MEQISAAIIGAGRIGKLHADHLIESEDFRLTAIADVFTDHIKDTKYESAADYLTHDTETIFKDDRIDAVFICSSTSTHPQLIKQAAVSGKHIFCEKPISFSLKESKEAVDAAKKQNVIFQVGFNRRFDKHFKKVKDAVFNKKIGEPHIVKISSRDPEPPPEAYITTSGGLFMDMTIHDFDMIRFLTGKDVVEIQVNAAQLVDERFKRTGDVDTAIITVTFSDESIGVIDNSRQAVYGYDQRIEVFGSEGVVSADNEATTNVTIQTKEAVTLDHPKYFFLDRYIEAYKEEVRAFASAIKSEAQVLCSGEDGFKAELLAHAAKKSYEEARKVTIDEIELDLVSEV
ncbi:inositol 2-dehydrogenase [Thalassobacillus sp. CUG 92003]|uniref:inositol 2-dehydrogenase n=1 Tax=Thalassobacillus sp. CUG 92003 TaxID=2736641 RepID=UPI0015E6AE0E|nr:inositol 2-dehydrogenase [Thalassobacillus sp. CUG 92003]